MINKMNVRGLIALILVTMLMAVTATAALADDHDDMVEVTVKHGINGKSLGLEKALPVDVCVNGGLVETFEFKDSFEAELPEGEYLFEVYLDSDADCGGEDKVISFGPAFLSGGSDVEAKAKLGKDGAPMLKVKVEAGD